MTIKCFKVEKLIRDKTPALLESKGIAVHAKAMEDQEFISKLKDKLLEEAKEEVRSDDKAKSLSIYTNASKNWRMRSWRESTIEEISLVL